MHHHMTCMNFKLSVKDVILTNEVSNRRRTRSSQIEMADPCSANIKLCSTGMKEDVFALLVRFVHKSDTKQRIER